MTDWKWIIALIGLIPATAAAFAAWRSANATNRTVRAQILMQVMAFYSSDEMFEAMTELRNWKEKHGSKFYHRFEKLKSTSPLEPEFKSINAYRRKVSHHFHNIKRLLDTEIIDEYMVKTIVKQYQIKFLLEVIYPLERQIEYCQHSTFKYFAELYNRTDADKGNRLKCIEKCHIRPPI